MEPLSEQDVLNRLAALGIQVSRSQYMRWKDAGLFFPSGSRRGRGQGKGRAAHVYSDVVVRQVAEIARMLKENLDFAEIG